MADNSELPDFAWDPQQLTDIFIHKPLNIDAESDRLHDAFLVETLDLLNDNPQFNGALVMFDQVEDRLRYMLFNDTNRLDMIEYLTMIIARLVDLQRTNPELPPTT